MPAKGKLPVALDASENEISKCRYPHSNRSGPEMQSDYNGDVMVGGGSSMSIGIKSREKEK